jgi:transcriptional regulator with XRE-family HTH domain
MTGPYATAVGQRMREIREARGMTRPQVTRASRGQFDAQMLGSWERGDRGLYAEDLAAYAQWLGVDIRLLLPREQATEATRGTGS